MEQGMKEHLLHTAILPRKRIHENAICTNYCYYCITTNILAHGSLFDQFKPTFLDEPSVVVVQFAPPSPHCYQAKQLSPSHVLISAPIHKKGWQNRASLLNFPCSQIMVMNKTFTLTWESNLVYYILAIYFLANQRIIHLGQTWSKEWLSAL